MLACAVSVSGLAVASPLAGATVQQSHHRHSSNRHQNRHRHSRRAGGASSATPSGRPVASGGTAPTWSATAPCANADTPAGAQNVQEMTAAVDCLVNQERLRFGLPPLNVSSELNQSAQGWSTHLVATDQYFHGDVSARLTAAGYDWREGGENIATGDGTPRDVLAAWMASAGHCENILEPTYRDMGTGESFGGLYAPMWVQDFGTSMGEQSLSSNYGPANGCPYSIPSSAGSSSASSSSGSTSSCSAAGATPWPSSPDCTQTSTTTGRLS